MQGDLGLPSVGGYGVGEKEKINEGFELSLGLGFWIILRM